MTHRPCLLKNFFNHGLKTKIIFLISSGSPSEKGSHQGDQDQENQWDRGQNHQLHHKDPCLDLQALLLKLKRRKNTRKIKIRKRNDVAAWTPTVTVSSQIPSLTKNRQIVAFIKCKLWFDEFFHLIIKVLLKKNYYKRYSKMDWIGQKILKL